MLWHREGEVRAGRKIRQSEHREAERRFWHRSPGPPGALAKGKDPTTTQFTPVGPASLAEATG